MQANGSVEEDGEDENEEARTRLKDAGCLVHDRFLAPKALAHNKFVVIGRRDGEDFTPEKVWTGSTNWTPTGLCTQLNNGIMLVNEELAARFEAQFQLLAKARNVVSYDLPGSNDRPERGLSRSATRRLIAGSRS